MLQERSRPLRQRPSRQDDHARTSARSSPSRHAEGSRVGSVRTSSAARRLLGRSSSSSARRSSSISAGAEQDGARALKPFIYTSWKSGYVNTIKERQEARREGAPGGLGHSRRGHQRAPVLLNRAPTLHRLGIQAFEPSSSRQGHPAAPARLRGVQRRLRRRPDGRPRAALHRSPDGSPRAHDEHEQHPLAANGKPIINPTQDIVLGLYYATRERKFAKGAT